MRLHECNVCHSVHLFLLSLPVESKQLRQTIMNNGERRRGGGNEGGQGGVSSWREGRRRCSFKPTDNLAFFQHLKI